MSATRDGKYDLKAVEKPNVREVGVLKLETQFYII